MLSGGEVGEVYQRGGAFIQYFGGVDRFYKKRKETGNDNIAVLVDVMVVRGKF